MSLFTDSLLDILTLGLILIIGLCAYYWSNDMLKR